MRGKSLLWMPLAAMLIISMSVITATAPVTPVVSISPSKKTAYVGEYFTFDIIIDNVVEPKLWGWEVMISFGLGITPYTIEEYDGVGGMKWLAEIAGTDTEFNYAKKPGYILVSCFFKEKLNINGTFPLASVTMLALEPTETPLHFDYVRLWDVNGNFMPNDPVDGLFVSSEYLEANLIMKRVDPNRRPRVGDTVTFVGRVKNRDFSTHDLYVKVVFDVYKEEGPLIPNLETNVETIAPGAESGELTVDWTAVEGRYYGTATAWWSINGVDWDISRTGEKVKAFSFEVRP